MRKFFGGMFIGVSAFLIGAAAGSAVNGGSDAEMRPAVLLTDTADGGIPRIGLCELAFDPDKYDGRLVRVPARYGWVNPTILGYFHAKDCGKLLRAACPPNQEGCRKLLGMQNENVTSGGDVEVLGRFVRDRHTPRGTEHRIEIWDVFSAAPSGGDRCRRRHGAAWEHPSGGGH